MEGRHGFGEFTVADELVQRRQIRSKTKEAIQTVM